MTRITDIGQCNLMPWFNLVFSIINKEKSGTVKITVPLNYVLSCFLAAYRTKYLVRYYPRAVSIINITSVILKSPEPSMSADSL